MPINQLTQRCWVPSWDGDNRTEDERSQGPHYGDPTSMPESDDRPGYAWFHKDCGGVLIFDLSGGFCMRCEAEGVDEDGYEIRKMVPYQLAGGCWTGTCGRCGRELEDEEEGSLHNLTADGVRKWAADEHWDLGLDGDIICRTWDLEDDLSTVWLPCDGEDGDA